MPCDVRIATVIPGVRVCPLSDPSAQHATLIINYLFVVIAVLLANIPAI